MCSAICHRDMAPEGEGKLDGAALYFTFRDEDAILITKQKEYLSMNLKTI
jgi:hypothetical protein